MESTGEKPGIRGRVINEKAAVNDQSSMTANVFDDFSVRDAPP
jgi:hypothetical protein